MTDTWRPMIVADLAAVHGTETPSSRHGFAAAPGNDAALATYGKTARVMTRPAR